MIDYLTINVEGMGQNHNYRNIVEPIVTGWRALDVLVPGQAAENVEELLQPVG